MLKVSNLIVSRFGGDAAANPDNVKKAAEIILSNPDRRFVIISAPGANDESLGITDMLYMCYSNFVEHKDFEGVLMGISYRFKEIVSGLEIDFDVDAEIDALRKSLVSGVNLDYVGSRGEFIMSKIFAKYMGWEFVDTVDMIFFDKNGKPDKEKTFNAAYNKLKFIDNAVIPSFYGTDANGKIKTCVRGDCDTSGALIACAVKADLFEKWSESTKIFSADPKVIPNAEIVRHITYGEAIELNYIGINIVKDDVSMLLNEAKIPMKIESIFGSDGDAMFITHELPENVSRSPVVCITGHNNFNCINIQKIGLNKNYNFENNLFAIFAKHSIAARHYVTGIHKLSIFLKNPRFDLQRNEILNDIKKTVNPLSVTITKDLSLIAIVGEGIMRIKGILDKITVALSNENIELRVIDYGGDELNIILGVNDRDYAKTVKVLHENIIVK